MLKLRCKPMHSDNRVASRACAHGHAQVIPTQHIEDFIQNFQKLCQVSTRSAKFTVLKKKLIHISIVYIF